MIPLIIIGSIVLLIAFLMMFSVRAEIKYYGEILELKVKYLFFTLYSLNTAEKKNNDDIQDNDVTESSKDESDVSSEKNNNDILENFDEAASQNDETDLGEEKKKKEKLSEKIEGLKVKIEQFKIIWECSKKGLAKIFKHIYITNVVIDFIAGGEDAMTAGTNYGKLNAIVYNGINLIRTLFTVTVKTVDINCDFDLKKSVYNAECVIKLRVGTAVSAVLMIAWALLLNLNKIKSVGTENEEIN